MWSTSTSPWRCTSGPLGDQMKNIWQVSSHKTISKHNGVPLNMSMFQALSYPLLSTHTNYIGHICTRYNTCTLTIHMVWYKHECKQHMSVLKACNYSLRLKVNKSMRCLTTTFAQNLLSSWKTRTLCSSLCVCACACMHMFLSVWVCECMCVCMHLSGCLYVFQPCAFSGM